MNELEEEFKRVYNEVMPKIKAKLREAEKALDEACRLADANNIPFRSPVSHISQKYGVNDLKWKPLEDDGELWENLSNLVGDNLYNAEYEGWQHSAVC